MSRLASSFFEAIPQARYACLVNAGNQVSENWDHLNASRATFEANRWKLLHGAPATPTTPVLPKVTDAPRSRGLWAGTEVCIVKQMKEAWRS